MSRSQEIINQLAALDTEKINPDSLDIDRLPAIEIVHKISQEDVKVADIVAGASEQIAEASVIYADILREGGRVFYIGAGTSGRLGVLDAAECPPTFGTDPEKIKGVIAGGYATLVLSKEGIEDDEKAAVNDLEGFNVGKGDFVLGIAASTRTPYTLAGLKYAFEMGCSTGLIVCNKMDMVPEYVGILIELPVGPEIITGSTRMKSGTAQKMALNMISTTAMILLGKTYGNLMIDLKARSEKLAARSRKMLMDLLGVSLSEADELLEKSDGGVKTAFVMVQRKCNYEEALKIIEEADGFIRRCL